MLKRGLDGWAYLLMSPQKELAFAYFENNCEIPRISGFVPAMKYQIQWFDPETGKWVKDPLKTSAGADGNIKLAGFPDGRKVSGKDWCLKIKSN